MYCCVHAAKYIQKDSIPESAWLKSVMLINYIVPRSIAQRKNK